MDLKEKVHEQVKAGWGEEHARQGRKEKRLPRERERNVRKAEWRRERG